MKKSLHQRWKGIPGWLKWVGGILTVLLVLFVLRYPILRGLGNALIYENAAKKCEVMFVLSGSPYDRGSEAARLLREGWTQRIVCTGGIIPPDFKALDLDYRESDLLRHRLQALNVPDSLIEILPEGTSTKEEAEAILKYCRDHKIGSAMVVSSKLHTRRIKQVFRKKFRRAGIQLCIRGAPSSLYKESVWWQNEYGLLTVNNEYVKMLWYLLH